MRFWILRLSSGSVTSVQSRSSLGLDFDFFDEEEEELPFRELLELCFELPAILLFLGSTSGVSRCAVLEDLFFLCLLCPSRGVSEGRDLARRGCSSSSEASSSSSYRYWYWLCWACGTSGEALCILISGGCKSEAEYLGDDIYPQSIIQEKPQVRASRLSRQE